MWLKISPNCCCSVTKSIQLCDPTDYKSKLLYFTSTKQVIGFCLLIDTSKYTYISSLINSRHFFTNTDLEDILLFTEAMLNKYITVSFFTLHSQYFLIAFFVGRPILSTVVEIRGQQTMACGQGKPITCFYIVLELRLLQHCKMIG